MPRHRRRAAGRRPGGYLWRLSFDPPHPRTRFRSLGLMWGEKTRDNMGTVPGIPAAPLRFGPGFESRLMRRAWLSGNYRCLVVAILFAHTFIETVAATLQCVKYQVNRSGHSPAHRRGVATWPSGRAWTP